VALAPVVRVLRTLSASARSPSEPPDAETGWGHQPRLNGAVLTYEQNDTPRPCTPGALDDVLPPGPASWRVRSKQELPRVDGRDGGEIVLHLMIGLRGSGAGFAVMHIT
jgi:hypothetical protein